MPVDYEAEYNNQQRVPEIVSIAPVWAARSQALRSTVMAECDIPYGADPRQRYDILYPSRDAAQAPIAVFIHGGYWQARDRKDFTFVASGCLAHGVAVAMPSYRLAPAVGIIDIIADMRAFLVALLRRTGRRAAITGHSAGGHLTAALLATDWSEIPDVPADLARFGYAISGVFDLAPLLTTSLNVALRETPQSAPVVSPLHWPLPARDRCMTAAVGSAESSEFIRQSVDMAARWDRAGIPAEAVLIPGANHFTILEDLARPDSAMVARIVDFARQAA